MLSRGVRKHLRLKAMYARLALEPGSRGMRARAWLERYEIPISMRPYSHADLVKMQREAVSHRVAMRTRQQQPKGHPKAW